MNKYYHRGQGECIEANIAKTTAYCDPSRPIGWVENCREQYQMLNPIGEWVDCEESMWGLMAKHMRRIFLIPDAPVSGEEKVCLCKNVEVGSYHNQVELPAPDFMKSYLKARGQNTDTICVDTCLSFEIQNLWYWGIATTGCCCGHNKVPPYIGVIESDILRMRSFRYKSHQGKNDSFYPKTLPLPQSVKDEDGEGEESVVRIVHNGKKRYWCKCEDCGWENSSEYAAGGSPIADTGDYSDAMCPVCGSLKIDGESKYFKDEDYTKCIVEIPFDEFIAPYNKIIDKANRLEADKYWQSVEENGGMESPPSEGLDEAAKEWEVLKENEGEILSLRRLSDGIIFSVGDEVEIKQIHGKKTIIQKFILSHECLTVQHKGRLTEGFAFLDHIVPLPKSTPVSSEAVENNGGVLVLVGTDGKAFIVNDLIKWETDGSCETGDTLYSAIIVKKY